MLDVRNLIDLSRLGEKKILVDVIELFEYQNNKRTNNHLGYKYIVALPAHKFEKLSVRIDSETPLIEFKDTYLEVEFRDLDLYPYDSNGTITVSAKATGIKVVGSKA